MIREIIEGHVILEYFEPFFEILEIGLPFILAFSIIKIIKYIIKTIF